MIHRQGIHRAEGTFLNNRRKTDEKWQEEKEK